MRSRIRLDRPGFGLLVQQMVLKFTKQAIEKASDIKMRHPEYRDSPLRVFLSGKGCDGFEYGVAFDEVLADDHVLDIAGIAVCVDSKDAAVLDGSTVDYVNDERGEGFLVRNPNQDKYQGKYWQESQDQ